MNVLKKILIGIGYLIAGLITFSYLHEKAMQQDRESRPWMYKRHWEIKNGIK